MDLGFSISDVNRIMLNTVNHHYVEKGWGHELWVTNSEKYCGKRLFILNGKKLSWHYHKLKDEVMFVQSGKIIINFGYDEDESKSESITLSVGDSFHIPVGLIHRITGLEDSEIFEFSTQHFDEDSYRITQGDIIK
jgi:mannose-6-phosphate isomerase-like protein (cupin superfamily)